MTTLPYWMSAGISAMACMALIRSFGPVARRIGLVDRPGPRKHHPTPVPLVGGLAIFCGMLFGLMAGGESLGPLRALISGMGLLLLVGLLDDFHELSASARFLAQLGAALAMALWADVRLVDFGVLWGTRPVELGWLSVPVTVFCVVGVINAVNMIDGMDGLAGSLIVLCLVVLGFQWAGVRQGPELALMIVTAAAVLGFLFFNLRIGRETGSVFLGDAGTLPLGFLLAWLLVDGSQGPVRAFAPVTALWLLALPLIDTVYVMIRRLRRGRSPFSPGRDHLHHLFVRSGFGAWATLGCLMVMALVMASAGVAMEHLGVAESLRFVAFLLLCAGYHAWVDRAWRRARWLGRPLNREEPSA